MGIMKEFKCKTTGRMVKKASKNCTACYQWKPLEEFGKSKAGKYGRKSQCKVCLAKKDRERYSKNKRKIWNIKEIKKYNDELAEKNAKSPEERFGISWKTLGILRDYTCPKSNITYKNIRCKMCNSCDTWKPLEEYHKHKRGRYGRRSQCKECVNKKERERKLLKKRENNESKD